MSSVDRLLSTVLPVTALGSFWHSNRKFYLVAKGSSLEAIDAESFASLGRCVILNNQAIHGIVFVYTSDTASRNNEYHCLIYGGRQIVWLSFNLTLPSSDDLRVSWTIVDTFIATDWILCCKETSKITPTVAFVTSYNTLCRLEANHATWRLCCDVISQKTDVFLYSADFVQRSDQNFIIASGTPLGEVLIWTCYFNSQSQRWISQSCFWLNGHQGSIFGVSISEPHVCGDNEHLYVATCSDDRMIFIWRLPADTIVESSLAADTHEVLRYNRSFIKTYAHLSRIWSIDFQAVPQTDLANLFLVSTGEDGQAQSWAIDLTSSIENKGARLLNKYSDRHHQGKNIWARSMSRYRNDMRFLTGGADGQVVERDYDGTGGANHSSRSFARMFQAIELSATENGTLWKKPIALKSYLMIQPGQILATSDSGHLLKADLKSDNIKWRLCFSDSKNITPIVAAHVIWNDVLFVRMSDYTLCSFHVDHNQIAEICALRQARIANLWIASDIDDTIEAVSEICVVISYHNSLFLELLWLDIDKKSVKKTAKSFASLPEHFEVTSVYYDRPLRTLICGSRNGALLVYTEIFPSTNHVQPAICNHRVHGQDTVTSICKIKQNSKLSEQSFYTTTGRDGTYCVHRLYVDEPEKSRLQTVHQSIPPFGPNIEGANIVIRPDGTYTILLHGFRSKSFLVWNESDQTQVMSIDCGGPHRSWTFQLGNDKHRRAIFIWTKAKAFEYYEQTSSDHKIIQKGGHGREIKALAIHKLQSNRWLLATGSEDTDIRLFNCMRNSRGEIAMRNTAVIRRHNTGLQALQFSPDGAVLISAASTEELFAWHLSSVPVINQGVVFSCALQSDEALSDARIMSLDTYTSHDEIDGPELNIVAAFSNGKLKIVRFIPASISDEAKFLHLHHIDFGTICLTQTGLIGRVSHQRSQPIVIIGATNGYVSACLVKSDGQTGSQLQVLSNEHSDNGFLHKIHQNSIATLEVLPLTTNHSLLVTGGDDNALAITIITTSSSTDTASQSPIPTFKSLIVPKAHAAALTSLKVLQRHSSKTSNVESSQSDSTPQEFTLITAGNDQRIQIWNLRFDVSALQLHRQQGCVSADLSEVTLDFNQEIYTNVADISAIEVLQDDNDDRSVDGVSDRLAAMDIASRRDNGHEQVEESNSDSTSGKAIQETIKTVDIVIVGVGMEILRIDLP